MPDKASEPVCLARIAVKPGRLVCDVLVAQACYRRTTPVLASCVLDSYPELAHHACVNEVAPTFGAVIGDTSVVHLLEHLVITLQTRATSTSAQFSGTTEWINEDEGLARMQLGFVDDLEALRALSEATRILNKAVLICLA